MLCSFIQCSTHSSIRHYSEVVFWLGIIHILIGLTLIIAINGLSQLDIGRLGKHGGFKLVGRVHQIGIIRQYCCSLSCTSCIVSTSCEYCCNFIFQFWYIVGSYQLTVRPLTHIPKFERGANTQSLLKTLLHNWKFWLRQRKDWMYQRWARKAWASTITTSIFTTFKCFVFRVRILHPRF